jgi:hypothetical protein
MKGHSIFLSSIFLSSCLSAAPLQKVSSQPAINHDHCSAKNAKKRIWESAGFRPPGVRARLPKRLFLFEFCAFSVVKLLHSGTRTLNLEL